MAVSVFYIAVLLILSVAGMKILPDGGNENIMADDSTRIKGILCVAVLFHHFSGWFTHPNAVIYAFSHSGSFIVAMFFFLSGYGLSKADSDKTISFCLVLKRILRLMIPYWICDILYLVGYYVFGLKLSTEVTALSIAESVLALKSIVSFSWYVPAMAAVYVLFYLCLKFVKKKYTAAVMLAVMAAGFVFVPDLWVSYFAFPIGVLFVKYEDRILCLLKKAANRLIAVTVPGLIVAASCVLKIFGQSTGNQLLMKVCDAVGSAAFVIAVFVILSRVKIGGRIAAFYGRISYEFYLLHGLGIYIANLFFDMDNALAFIAAALAVSTVMSIAVNFASGKITKPIMKKLS